AKGYEADMQEFRIFSSEEVEAIDIFFAIIIIAIVKKFQNGTIEPTNFLDQSTFDIIKPILLLMWD
ncbi:hypothetical protein, partial [Xanthobacter autotrophicus]|uniref:hypothetical protein n=1 Tax=Xanthobacter autotrophicus TaxID=280 RepID=UPI0024A709DF